MLIVFEPFADQWSKRLGDFRFNGQHSQLRADINQRQQICLRMTAASVTKIR